MNRQTFNKQIYLLEDSLHPKPISEVKRLFVIKSKTWEVANYHIISMREHENQGGE